MASAEDGGSSPLTRGKRQAGTTQRAVKGLIPAHAGKTSPDGFARERLGAHPRSRGENRRSCLICSMILGSSPLTRGKHQERGRLRDRLGLIPAHAGKTVCHIRGAGCRGAHPRSRGENQGDRIFDRSDNGSSPLTRGKPPDTAIRVSRERLIPAHAGKTHGKCARSPGRCGSSPLTRGKLQHRRVGHDGRGLIPAHAGKTRRRRSYHSTARAHPRSRGENI